MTLFWPEYMALFPDLFRIRFWIRICPDPAKSFGSVRIRIRIRFQIRNRNTAYMVTYVHGQVSTWSRMYKVMYLHGHVGHLHVCMIKIF